MTDQDASEGLPRWGVVATVHGPTRRIAEFCAYHIRAGATCIYLCLDDPGSEAAGALGWHDRVRVTRCDDAHWKALIGKRPIKHQVRQTLNASATYRRAAGEVDWLAHIDVDEFLVSDTPIAAALSRLPDACFCLRVRPMEPLAGAPGLFKSAVARGPDHDRIMGRLYPEWGDHLRGGLLSHAAGKLLVRTGAEDVTMRIHNVLRGADQNPEMQESWTIRLAHMHARSWEEFREAFQFRLTKGSYRADLAPNRPRDQGGVTLHELLEHIQRNEGDAGLRAFYDHVASARPDLVNGLESLGLLHRADLRLDEAVKSIFDRRI